MQVRNAVIEGTQLGFEDHGILTANLQLSYGGSGQSFGGYGFGCTTSELETQDGFGASFIATVLDMAGVDSWEKLKGRHIRVIQEHTKVWAIGHILENKWFCPGGKRPEEVDKIINDLDKVF